MQDNEIAERLNKSGAGLTTEQVDLVTEALRTDKELLDHVSGKEAKKVEHKPVHGKHKSE